MANNPLVTDDHVAVVMVPFPAQGHINPLLHLSHRLVSDYNIPVYFTGTDTYIRQAKDRVHGWDPLLFTTNMHFHEFSTNHRHDLGALSSSSVLLLDNMPTHLIPLIVATTHIREPVYAFVNNLSNKYRKVVVIYDYLMSYLVQDIHSIRKALAYRFHALSACDSLRIHRKGARHDHDQQKVEEEILSMMMKIDHHQSAEALKFLDMQENARKVFTADIYNSNREIEGVFFDLLEKEKARGAEKVWCLGPFSPLLMEDNSTTRPVSKCRHECLDWLDKHEPNSVIFVSFGSTTTLLDEQIEEIAYGLERSEQKFLWVLRDADRSGDESTKLCTLSIVGFEERVKGRGVVVRDWAPQLDILRHSSIGGFLSHCGWNSCMESISHGVPIATWPISLDQPTNALLITRMLKIGVEIVDWERWAENVSADTVEKAVRTLIASEEGDEMRKRAKELGNNVNNSIMEDGCARKEFDLFVAEITCKGSI